MSGKLLRSAELNDDSAKDVCESERGDWRGGAGIPEVDLSEIFGKLCRRFVVYACKTQPDSTRFN